MRPKLSRPAAARRLAIALAGTTLIVAPILGLTNGAASAASKPASHVKPQSVGGLDCNGFSPIQQTVKPTQACTDPKGYDGGRFYDNGHYIGHDEPIVRFVSHHPRSGRDVVWNETLPVDPAANPTVATPGSDVTHFFELSVAPWFSMALCNPDSYPLAPCTPESDSNAAKGSFPGGGSSFLEVQFYPPGYGPFVDNISCDNTHWCASLHINDLECTNGFESCNPNCIEPTNFAFIQMDGVPTGPPSPQLANLATDTPNNQTLLMNPGDKLSVHIFDKDVRGGQKALKVSIDDLTTGMSGYMVASAANGYMSTSFTDCSGTPFNYAAEYDTASFPNTVPWAALQVNISTEYEIGHFTPCSKVTQPSTVSFDGFTDTYWNNCKGPYEGLTKNEPPGEDPFCYRNGDTHGGTSDPNLVTGCVGFLGGGDVDFDGTPYWADWPDSTTPDSWPSTFLQQSPTTGGHRYKSIQFQTDVAASESSCHPFGTSGCRVPPPGGPGHFYPYWTQATVDGTCVWEFGQMTNGNTYGGVKQYGVSSAWYYGNLESALLPNPC